MVRDYDQALAILDDPSGPPPSMDRFDWVYGYAAYFIPEEVEARIGLLDVLSNLRRVNLVLGRSTEEYSRQDHWFLRACIDQNRPLDALPRLALLDQPVFSADDLQRPRLMREAAEISWLIKDYDGSEPWLNRAFEQLDRLASEPADLDRASQLIAVRLDLFATGFQAELESGAPDQAEHWLDRFEQAIQQPAVLEATELPYWILDGAFLRTRILDAFDEHALAQDAAEAALSHPAVAPLASADPQPREYLRVVARQALARSRAAQSTADRSRIEDALKELQAVLVSPNLGDPSDTWLRIELVRLRFALGQAEQAHDELRALQKKMVESRTAPEVAQALAVQWGRAGLAGVLDADGLRECEDRLADAWQAMVIDRARARSRKGGLAVLWFPAQRDLLETLLRVRSVNRSPDVAASQGLIDLLELQKHGSLISDLRGERQPSPVHLASILPKGAGALVYFSAREALHVFVLREGSVTRIEVPVEELTRKEILRDLQHAIVEVRARPSARSEEALQAARNRAARLLLPAGALDQLAAGQALVVCGLEDLPYVPFEYLPRVDGAPLGCTLAVQQASSLPLWSELVRGPQDVAAIDSRRVVSLTHIEAGAQGSAARLGSRDRERLLAHLDRAHVESLAGKGAHIEDLAHALEQPAQALFLMAHGLADGMETALLLADDERLEAERLETMALPRYIHFDTCGAGQRARRPGDDGRGGLLGASLIGGARALVLPLWDVDARAAMLLRVEVQRGLLADGLEVAEAWRVARQRLRAGQGGLHPIEFFLHPVFGNGFATLVPHEQRKEQGPRKWTPALGLIAAAGASWWLVRRLRALDRIPT